MKEPQRSSGPAASVAESLEAALKLGFRDPALLVTALTHRSFGASHNERLEFLGDAVLGLAISELLYGQQPDFSEGQLSRTRSNLVRQESLHRIALKLNLPKHVRLGAGEVKSGGLTRPSILADAVEAIIGAVYLDGGPAAADALVRRLFERVEISPAMSAAAKDAKTALQEWLQGRKMALPQYEVTQILGAAHRQTFEVACRVPQLDLEALGQGVSRRAAEQAAAATMLQMLESNAT